MIGESISVVVPCYNEQDNILNMYQRLKNTLEKITTRYEIIYINNGSYDNSEEIFQDLAARDTKVTIITLSRNYGSQNAYTCGMEYASGDCVVCIDGDIQDPPELIEEMVKKWQDGFRVVYGIRQRRKGGIIRRICYKIFYRLFQKLSYVDMPLDAGDFALIDRRVLNVINALPERGRFIRGLRAWVGFRQTGIEYTRDDRVAGKSNYNFMANVRWAVMAIFTFSYSPLEFISFLALVTVVIALLGIIFYIGNYFIFGAAPHGFSTTIITILFLGGIQLLCLSIIGEYLGKLFEEVKGRPNYIIQEILNNCRDRETP
jgi:glycosyltransferase involved in cell wall biosynthesis